MEIAPERANVLHVPWRSVYLPSFGHGYWGSAQAMVRFACAG
jgi:hypothetical protein